MTVVKMPLMVAKERIRGEVPVRLIVLGVMSGIHIVKVHFVLFLLVDPRNRFMSSVFSAMSCLFGLGSPLPVYPHVRSGNRHVFGM